MNISVPACNGQLSKHFNVNSCGSGGYGASPYNGQNGNVVIEVRIVTPAAITSNTPTISPSLSIAPSLYMAPKSDPRSSDITEVGLKVDNSPFHEHLVHSNPCICACRRFNVGLFYFKI